MSMTEKNKKYKSSKLKEQEDKWLLKIKPPFLPHGPPSSAICWPDFMNDANYGESAHTRCLKQPPICLVWLILIGKGSATSSF